MSKTNAIYAKKRRFIQKKDAVLTADDPRTTVMFGTTAVRTVLDGYKYGWASDTYPELADAVASLEQRLEMYKRTGNRECLVDIGNFAMIEYMRPRHPDAHFEATDSDQSPGLVGISYKQMMEELNNAD